MTAACSLIRMVDRAHELLSEVLAPGDVAVDLTAGNGIDTLFLAEQVGPTGRVVAFDIQEQALQHTMALLEDAALVCSLLEPSPEPVALPDSGVILIRDSHCQLQRYLQGPLQAIIANLGYLPGGNEHLVTRAETTLAALRQGLELLKQGGRLVVVVYVGHAGADRECCQVETLMQSLSPRQWQVLRIQVVNRELAPYLLVAERR
ncbi:MAG: class I SAM-dependent methyltransferase [Desulfuromonadaceae bacterium]